MKTIKYFMGVVIVALLAACTSAPEPTPPTPNPDPNPNPGDTTQFEGKGTKADPYTVADVIKMNPTSTEATNYGGVWVSGYIVGVYDNSTNPATLDLDAPFASNVNLVISTSATGATLTNSVCIQLPAGAIRDSINLQTHEAYAGLELKVYGDVMKYNSMPGVKNTAGYWLVEADKGVNPPEAGNFDVPEITFAQLKALYTSGTVTLTEDSKIVGIVVTDLVGGNSTSLKNIVITNLDNTSGLAVRFTDKDNVYALNDKIEILLSSGTLSLYSGALQLQVSQVRTQGLGQITPPAPHLKTLAQLAAEYDDYEYTVVQTEGTVTPGTTGSTVWGSSASHVSNILTDNGNTAILFVSKYASFVNSPLPTAPVTVRGILQKYNSELQIIIRNLDDVESL